MSQQAELEQKAARRIKKEEAEVQHRAPGPAQRDRITQAINIILSRREESMTQVQLASEMHVGMQAAARIAANLARRGIVKREMQTVEGRWGYVLTRLVKPSPSVESIRNLPCLTCPYEPKCSTDKDNPINPKYCPWLAQWLTDGFAMAKNLIQLQDSPKPNRSAKGKRDMK